MGGRIKVIRETDYPPDARTAEERFAHLAKRMFAADAAKVRGKLAAEEAAREEANPGPVRKRGRLPKAGK